MARGAESNQSADDLRVGDALVLSAPLVWDDVYGDDLERVGPADPERLPPWLAATILVAYCGVFWVGLITVARWVLLPWFA